MRFEAHYIILMACLIGVFIISLLSKTSLPNLPYKIILAILVALTMPAFVPGHGEFIMLLPTAGLFAFPSSMAWGAGIIFLIINYLISWLVLYKICGLFKNRT